MVERTQTETRCGEPGCDSLIKITGTGLKVPTSDETAIAVGWVRTRYDGWRCNTHQD